MFNTNDYGKRDFKPWFCEKNEKVIQTCFKILESTGDVLLKKDIYNIMYNSLCIEIALCGKLDVCKELTTYFMSHTWKEYCKWKILLEEPDRNKKMVLCDNVMVYDEILDCITEDMWYKSCLPEKIAHYKMNTTRGTNKWLDTIDDDLEKVNMGEKPWRWFYTKHCNDKEIYKHKISFNDLLRLIKMEVHPNDQTKI